MAFKTTRTDAQENSSKKQDFFIINIFKGYKITYFIRPIEFDTTTNKIATRNPAEFGFRNDYVPQGH
jgi:phospholipase/lecithinase/hemolysin